MRDISHATSVTSKGKNVCGGGGLHSACSRAKQ
jgi:hypothetical protein